MLSQRQQRALQALMEAPDKRTAARLASIGERTLRTYLADADFVSELRKLQTEQVEAAAQRGRQSMIGAIDTLKAIADDENTNAQNRIMACRALLEYTLRLDERENVLRRLDELEAVMGGQRE